MLVFEENDPSDVQMFMMIQMMMTMFAVGTSGEVNRTCRVYVERVGREEDF